MKSITIHPGNLRGEVDIPASKSICHRAVICAGLSDGVSHIQNVTFSEDIEATCSGMKQLGAKIQQNDNSLWINGISQPNVNNPVFDCGESGSTLRFLIPIGAAMGQKVTYTGRGKLVERPLNPYYEIFDEQKLFYKNHEGKLPLTIDGRLKPGQYKIHGDISSQFISGLLFALPLLEDASRIILTTKLESRPYIDLTMDVLKLFSIDIENLDYNEFVIKGNQRYKAWDYFIEGDFSQAAFWLAAGILGEAIVCKGLNASSHQGDKSIVDVITRMGGSLLIENDSIKAAPSTTHGTIIDASQCPDLVPILAVLGALSHGTTEIINAGRLRLKESDRLHAVSQELKKLGADIKEKEEGLAIKGKERLRGGTVSGWNDHRIAMAMAVASIKCTKPVTIEGADCVKKSYPGFWRDFNRLGGNVDEQCMGE